MKYLIAIALPKNLSQKLAKIQRQYKSSRWNIALPPHITLIPPANLLTDFDNLFSDLSKFTNNIEPFEIKICGIDKFVNKGNTIFAKIVENKPLQDIHQSMTRIALKHLNISKDYPDIFCPHITLSNNLTVERAKIIYSKIEKLIQKEKFLVSDITLYKRPRNSKKYQKVSYFYFKNNCSKIVKE